MRREGDRVGHQRARPRAGVVRTIEALVDEIRRAEACVVQPPRAMPSVRPGEALGRELEEFYRACGGLSLFAASDYGVEIAGPESFSRANLEIVGREVPDDLTDSWYVLARAASGSGSRSTATPPGSDAATTASGIPTACGEVARSSRCHSPSSSLASSPREGSIGTGWRTTGTATATPTPRDPSRVRGSRWGKTTHEG